MLGKSFLRGIYILILILFLFYNEINLKMEFFKSREESLFDFFIFLIKLNNPKKFKRF